MTQDEGPGWAASDAGSPADPAGEPLPPGTSGPPWQAPPPHAAGSPPAEGLAVAALVLAVVSLLVPLLPGIVALVLAEPPATEPPPTEPATTPPKVAVGRVGDRLTAYDEFGTARLELTVTRVKFWAGDQFDQPEHGLYMGAYVKVRALADEQDTPWEDSYALVGGHRYPGGAITISTAFEPPLDPITLNQDEETSGWLVFDVPARHGQLVLRDILNERPLGIWKY